MQQNFDLEYLIGNSSLVEAMPQQPAFPIFSKIVCDFLQAVSQRLLKNAAVKAYPDVVTFAFWCRKASLQQMRKAYDLHEMRLGRGVVFHIAPSNVAVNFAYSFVAALLAGNASIVRVPSKNFIQVDLICEAIREELQEDFSGLQNFICMARYGHEPEINTYFSSFCDTRVIWGGDQTIREIRKSPLKPRANEITFADRFSLAMIQSEAYLAAEDKERIAQDFYNDTYLTDQNACTSPRLVIWLGNTVREAQAVFWKQLYEIVKNKYSLSDVCAVDKLTRLFLLGEQYDAEQIPMPDNRIVRVQLNSLDKYLMDFKGNSGFFLEYISDDLESLLTISSERCQTLSYYGIDKSKVVKMLLERGVHGIDRVVPIGRSMDFSLQWDGHDLIRELSRLIK